MERQTDSQYDDDLTVGIADYDDESIDAGYVDLFEYSGEEESPIARLKTIVLSIDWEITDEVLTQFNDELTDLHDIWADDPVKLVYVQALQKIGKYIFQQKSDSHPSAIKLLLTFYYNLEKIVLDAELSEAEEKEILRSDVKKFEQLKRQIEAETAKTKKPAVGPAGAASLSLSEHGAAHPVLFNLKACILGMDWEITERELSDLSKEIRRLEVEFAGDKPRLLFLQGIEALGGYIRLKKSNAHADAFKLLYSFYEGLEKIVVNEVSIEEQKAILFPEVEKFEQFKKIILPSLTEGAPADEDDAGAADDYEAGEGTSVAPAFADVPDEVHGFQADEEAAQLGEDVPNDVEDRLEQFFSEGGDGEPVAVEETPASAGPEDSFTQEAAQRVASFFDTEESRAGSSYMSISAEEALRGVDVETDADDDSDEEALPVEPSGTLAPALADTEGEPATIFGDTSEEAIAWSDDESVHEVQKRLGGFFDQEAEEGLVSQVAADSALRGVDVESEADDDTEEAALPLSDDEDLAPALSMEEEDGGVESADEGEMVGSDIEDRLETLFAEDDAVVSSALEGVDLDTERERDVEPTPQPAASLDDESPALFESEESIEFESQLDSFFDDSDDRDDAGETADSLETAGVEDQVAAFFEPADDTFAAPADLSPDEVAATPTVDDGETEGVVFTPVEDGQVVGEIAEGLIDDGDEDDGYATFASESDEEEFFAAIDERVDEPGEFQMELLDETDDIDTRDVASLSQPETDGADQPGEEPPPPAALTETDKEEDEEDAFVFASDDDLGDLRGAIASLGVEINDTIIQGILSAVNGLRHHYSNRPVEKTFLQLISTIVQHIGQYRYEASAEAHGLLLSVFDKLELIQNPELPAEQTHEILLAETTKVLLWQQTMLDRQAIRKGDELTFLSPVRSDQAEEMAEDEPSGDGDEIAGAAESASEEQVEQEDFQAVFEPVEEDDEHQQLAVTGGDEHEDDDDLFDLVGSDQPEESGIPDDSMILDDENAFSLDSPVDTEEDDSPFLSFDEELERSEDETASDDSSLSFAGVESEIGDAESLPQDDEGSGGDPVTEYVKKELAALRSSLQAEIEELRKRLESKDQS